MGGGSAVQDVGGLRHLHHEGRSPTGQVVGRAYAGKDSVDGSDAGRTGGYPATT